MSTEGHGPLTWRPTAQSFVNLAAFLGTLGAAAAVVLGTTDSPELTGVTAGLALVAGVGITAFITRKRVANALDEAETPALGNWPGSDDDRRALRHRGRIRAARSMAFAFVVGALCGFYPVLGVACVGAGFAGAVSAGAIARWIARYEAAHDVTVMTPSAPGGRRPPGAKRLRFGIASGRY